VGFSGIRKPAAVGTIALLAAIALLLAAAPAAPAAPPVWLCKPGIPANPCEPSLRTTVISPSGQPLGAYTPPARHRKIDCFYVYPTVSDQTTGNANLNVDPELRSVALYQAARYSQLCRVFAPVYRQVTVRSLLGLATTPGDFELAYSDVLNAWRTYLQKYNHGRGVVLIGHSQGSIHLIRLVREQIDPNPALRRKLVSALLLGWPVTVATGRDAGGDFQNIRACRSALQIGCVIAFSTFDEPVPANSRFARTSIPGRQALCTNPAALRGGSAPLRSIFPTEPFAPTTIIGAATAAVGFSVPQVGTPWVATVAYTGRCESANGANALQISGLPGAPNLSPIPDATWGLHLVDANIALGNLVSTVRVQSFVHFLLRHFHRR
jgi:Protein of unknown function (DUF3089)